MVLLILMVQVEEMFMGYGMFLNLTQLNLDLEVQL